MIIRRKLGAEMVRARPRVCSSPQNSLADGARQVVGGYPDGGPKSTGEIIERSDCCAGRQRVPHGGRLLACGKSAHEADGDIDAAFRGIGTDDGRGGPGVVHA